MGNCIFVLVLYMLSLVCVYQQNLYVLCLIWPCHRWRLCDWSWWNVNHCSYATLLLITIKNFIILNNTLFLTTGVCRSSSNILKGVSVYPKWVSVHPFSVLKALSHTVWVSIVLKKYPKSTLCTLSEKGTENRVRVLGIFKRPISQLKTANSGKKTCNLSYLNLT